MQGPFSCRRGWGPSPGALALTLLAWGSQEERKHDRAPEEVVSTYIQNWQLFVYMGAPLGSDLGGGPEPPLCGSRIIGSPDKKCAIVWKSPWAGGGGGRPRGLSLGSLGGSREKPKRGRSGSGPEPSLPILLRPM